MDDLGSLLAVVCANARSIEAKRGMLGLLNWSGSKLLTLAHRRLASGRPYPAKHVYSRAQSPLRSVQTGRRMS